jgi:cytochrome P450
VQPSFSAQRLSLLLRLIGSEIEEQLSVLESKLVDSGYIDMDPEINFLTLRIITRCLLGTDIPIGFEIHRATVTALDEIARRVNSVFALPLCLPTPRNIRLKRALVMMNEFIGTVIAARRAKPCNDIDLLSELLSATDEKDGRRMSDNQLRDELATFIVAGHETTANAIIWILYILSQHPGAVSGIRREINSKGSQASTISDLLDFPYLTKVVKESLRLYPPAWVILRKNLLDENFGGYHIPKGSLNVVCTHILHRQKNLWYDPETFRPERFLPEEHRKRHPYCYIPFGGGGRACVGRNFALLQITLFLVRFIKRFNFELAPNFTPKPLANITLRSANGMKLLLEKA